MAVGEKNICEACLTLSYGREIMGHQVEAKQVNNANLSTEAKDSNGGYISGLSSATQDIFSEILKLAYMSIIFKLCSSIVLLSTE